MAQEEMVAVLKAVDQTWSKGFGQAEDTISKFESNTKKSMDMAIKAVAAATAAVGAAVAGLAIKGTKDFIGFEKQMNEVFTLIPGTSDKAMKDMTGQVKDFSKEFGVLPEKVVPSLYSALSAGVPKDNVFSFLESSNKLAVGGVAELEDSVAVLSTITNNYKDSGLEAGDASDLLFTTVKKGVTTIPELASALGNVVPTASSLGVGFDEVSASMATMTSSLGKGSTSVATTQLRAMFDELGKGGTGVDKVFRDIAGVGFQEFISGGGSVQEALGMLNKHAEESDITIKELFSSTEAGGAALILGSSAAETFAENLEEMGNSAGATDTAFETMEQGLGRSFDKIKAALSVMSIEIGEKLAPFVAKFANAFIEYMPTIQRVVESVMSTVGSTIEAVANSKFVSSLIEVFQNIVSGASEAAGNPVWQAITDAFKQVGQAILDIDFVAVFDSISQFMDKWGPIIAGILAGVAAFAVLSSVIPAVVAAFNGLKILLTLVKSVGLIQTAFTLLAPVIGALSLPLIAIAAGIAAVVAIGIALYKNWDTIKAKASEIWNGIVDTIVNTLLSVEESFMNIMDSIMGVAANIWNSIYDTWTGWISSIFDSSNSQFGNIMNAIDDVMNNIWAIIESVWAYITGTFENAVGFIMALLSGDFATMKDMLGQQLDLMKQTASDIWESIKGVFSGAVDFIVAFVKGKFEEFTTKITEIWNSILENASVAWETIKTTVSTIVSSMVEAIVGFFTSMYTAYETTITPLVEMFTSIFGTIRDYVLSTWENIVTIGTELWNIIKNVVLGIVIVFLELLRGNFEGAKEAINGIWTNIKDSALTIWNTIKEQVMLIVTTFVELAKSIFTGMKDAIVGTYETLKNGAITIFTNMKDRVIAFFSELKTNAINAATNLKDTVITNFNTLKDNAISAALNLKDSVISFFTDLATGGKDKAIELKDEVNTGFRNMVDTAVTTASELPGKIKEKFDEMIGKAKEFISQAVQVGKDIVGGFVEGVKEKAQDMVSAVGDAIGDTISWAKKKLDSHSPSRVFKQLGLWTDEGYADGIDDGAKKPLGAVGNMIDGVIGVWDSVSLDKEANIASSFVVSRSEVDRALKSMINMPSLNFSNTSNQSSRVTHEINHNAQPMYLDLNLGGRHYRTFVDDISNTQNAQIQLQETYL